MIDGPCLLALPLQDTVEEQESEPPAPENSTSEDPGKSQGKGDAEDTSDEHTLLLQSGMAWAIGLSLRDTAAEILFRASCGLTTSPESEYPNLLYRCAPDLRARKF